MKLVVVSDLHLDKRTGGVARHDDIERTLFEAVEVANHTADFFLCLGDVMDPDSGSCVFRCVRTLTQACQRLSVPSIWLAGNHDVIEDGTGETTLEPLKGLTGPVSRIVVDQPGAYTFGGLTFFALPFTAYSHAYDPKKAVKKAFDANVASIASFRLVIGHLNVKGAQPGDEEDMVRGRDVWLPVKEIVTAFPEATIMNGHIHKRQVTEDGVIIPGTLERLHFDEERHQVGWTEVTL